MYNRVAASRAFWLDCRAMARFAALLILFLISAEASAQAYEVGGRYWLSSGMLLASFGFGIDDR